MADAANTAVAWTLTPANAGSVTADGLYTAPSVVTALQSVTLTATDFANSSWSTIATINLYSPGSLMLSPASANLMAGATQQFTPTLTNGIATDVTWSLNSSSAGSISATGLYTAPPVVAALQTVTVTATTADLRTATATIHLVPTTTVTVTPAATTLGPNQQQQFTASASGLWNNAVNWSVSPTGTGSITSAGLYTAPSTIAANTTVTIMAASVANPGMAGYADITLSPAAPSVAVAVTPPAVSLTPAQTQQFAATVTGTGNAAVTWSIIPSVGSISTSGLYTAPAIVASPQTVTLQAASIAYPANFATASITLAPPAANDYSYRRAVVIDHTKVANSDQTNFPVLISGTYSYLANVANGGKVQNTNGYDIVFSSDCAGLQNLNHEIQSYNPATGAAALWVLIPNVSHTVDTVFYLSYGNSTVTTSQENRASLDAARNPATPSPDWTATTLANQNSPSTFYTIYPENTNSIAPPTITLGSSQTQQFSALFTVGGPATTTNSLVLLGTSPTPSPAESVAINGNLAYVCDDNEVSVIDFTTPANPLFLGAVLASDIKNSGVARCAVRNRADGPVLLAFVDATGTWIGNNPAFVAFGLQNPAQPQLIAGTGIPRRFFKQAVYSSDGNTAFVVTSAKSTFLGWWDNQFGDVIAVDISNLSSPAVAASMEPQVDATLGGANSMFGAALANPTTLLVGGSTSTGASNDGIGELVVADVTTSTAISIVTTLPVPNTKQIYRPVVQGNLAVALGDTDGFNWTSYLGNLVLTTFDIANPRSPAILASIVLPYKPATSGPAVQIGVNLFVFAGAQDTSGSNLLLLVDTTDPRNPVVTPYPLPAPATDLVVAGSVLHVTAGAAGYAAYQIPGVTPTRLTGSCGAPVNWTLYPPTAGSLTASGLYTAPAGITTGQAVTVTATSQSDPTQTANATVNLSSVLTLSFAASAPSPYIAGYPAAFVATVTSAGGAPVSGLSITFAVTGVNPRTATTVVTDATGHASFSYTGATRGADSITASGTNLTPIALSALWLAPALPITTTPVTGEFFTATSCPSGCEPFNTPATQVPVFLQTFPNLMFNPPAGMLGVANTTRPFTDIVLDGSGAPTGVILAQGNGHQAGAGDLVGFSAVFRGTFVVAQAGTYTVNIASQDGFVFGAANGATRVSGINVNAPATTVFSHYPIMGANNGPSTGAPAPIVVTFPAPGSYPYEFDYRSGTGAPLSLAVTITQGATTLGLRPLDSLVLTPTSSAAPRTGQPATFTVKATDETGAPIANLSVSVDVSGIAPQTLRGTTDTTGLATVSYTETTLSTDVLQASALVNGLPLVSGQLTTTWSGAQAPDISVIGDKLLQLPNPGLYTATVTDPAAPAGGPITVQWTQLSGPGTVTFFPPSQPATVAIFTAPGTYYLQIAATDALGSNSLSVGPITVQAPVNTAQGWIGLPLDGSHVSGQVPITVATGITLTAGTLTYYPAANPTAVVTLNSDTTGSGQIGTLDTTLLNNGLYYVLLNATDSTGKTMGSGVWLNVIGDYKPGRVTTTVTDLVVPAPGMPIQISRTYDSLVRSASGDFGYGWSLGIKVQLEIGNTQDVTLTLNGQRRTFYFTPTGTVLGIYTPAYTAEPGMFGTLTSPTSNCGDGIANLLIKTGNIYVCLSRDLYQPQTLIYTDP